MDCFGHLALRLGCPDHVGRGRRADQPLDRETVDGIIRMLMDINAKLELLLARKTAMPGKMTLKSGEPSASNGIAIRVSSRLCTNA